MYDLILKYFERFVSLVTVAILLAIIASLAIGVVQLLISVVGLLNQIRVTGSYIGVITDVLTLYVLLELSRSLIDYFENQRIRQLALASIDTIPAPVFMNPPAAEELPNILYVIVDGRPMR